MRILHFTDGTPCKCKEIKRTYEDGALHEIALPCCREKFYYTNGNLRCDWPGTNNEGRREGRELRFCDNGRLIMKIPIAHNRRHGVSKQYDSTTGVLSKETVHTEGNTEASRYTYGEAKILKVAHVLNYMHGACSMENFV